MGEVVRVKIEEKTGELIKVKFKTSQMKRKDGEFKQTPCNSIDGNPKEVYPIKKKEEIEAMIQYFITKKNNADTDYNRKAAGRNLMMFVVGINVALRASDLLKLTWDDVFYDNGEFKDFNRLREGKTKKYKNLSYNAGAMNVINWYIKEFNPVIKPEGYVFKSREHGSLDIKTANQILKEAAKACGLQYNVGTHTMRKTFGYWYIQNNKDNMEALAELQDLLQHSSQKTTLKYIGLADEKTKKCYDSNVLGLF